jgi:hypothetical protein
MKSFFLDLDPAAANLTGFASNVTGAAFVLTQTRSGDTVEDVFYPDGLAHQVSIRNDTANSHSGKTVTLVGTDADGRPQTEVVTGPGVSATVESAKYFLTLTSATPSATIGADTFDIGWVDEFASPSIELLGESIPILETVLTGTMGYDIETTIVDKNRVADQEAMRFANDAGFTAKSASVVPTALAAVRKYFRVVCNSYTDTAELQVYGIQATPASNH